VRGEAVPSRFGLLVLEEAGEFEDDLNAFFNFSRNGIGEMRRLGIVR